MKPLPPCPDPERYILVRTKEGTFWRRKRGQVKEARLNTSLQANADHTHVTNLASRRVMAKLSPYFEGIEKGRLFARISGRFKKGLNAYGELTYAFLSEMDFQATHKFDALMRVQPGATISEQKFEVMISIEPNTIKRHSALITGYFFDLIMLYGDITKENGLRTQNDTSKLFAVGEAWDRKCKLSVDRPEGKWLAILKVSCLEGNQLAVSPRHYAMKVVYAGTD